VRGRDLQVTRGALGMQPEGQRMSNLRMPETFLVIIVIAALAVAAQGCSSARTPAVTSSASTTASAHPSTLPFAPPVTPRPGQLFVGYWRDATHTLFPRVEYYQVLYEADGYRVSLDGQPPTKAPLQNGRLVVQSLRESAGNGGAWVRPGAQLAWEDGSAVLYVTSDARVPIIRQRLRRLDRSAYVAGVNASADFQTRTLLNEVAIGVGLWADRDGQGPPVPAQLQPGSAFDRRLAAMSSPGAWIWPTNPFTGKPMASGSGPGDFTYVVNGDHWTLTGHLSDGSGFDANNP
jgi:hypothetical protein